MVLTLGSRLGTYEIGTPLGAGGMGEVYRARDLRLGREVALKVLPEELASDANRLARFEREARTVAGLNHPNIITLFSVEDEDGIRFLTMELVEGQSLAKLVTPGGLPVARVLEFGIALSDALTAAHEKGIVHRDLKPANVMLTREGRVKVLDFGLAKLMASDSALMLTQGATVAAPLSIEGQVVGTMPYMAPEQIRGESVDARTDLFALGIMLYELVAGKRPFAGPTPADVGSAILRDAPDPLARLRDDLPDDLARTVIRCLEKNPRDRIQTALDVCNELRRIEHARNFEERDPFAKTSAVAVASIAVLPFVNRSRDQDDEYFADGLADELLNVLAKIGGLRVAARASAFQFKGKNEDVAVIGHKLNVATILDGSVRKSGDRVRISVQLVNVADGYHLWSETYDRTLEDIFAVQDDIAQSVVKELRKALLGEEGGSQASAEAQAEVAEAARGRSTDPEAHRLYLQARYFIERVSRENMARGVASLKQALELDPAFALAWAELGGAYSSQAMYAWAPAEAAYERAREAVERALSLEPNLAEGHAQLGWIQMLRDWDWHGAEASLARALKLAPGNALVLRMSGTSARVQGRLEEAIELYRRAKEQDPLSARAYHNLGLMLHAADRSAEAEIAFRKALDLAPQRINTHAFLALALLSQGRGEEALAEAMSEPVDVFRLWVPAIIFHASGRLRESDELLRDLVENFAGDTAFQIAELHAVRDEADRAFEWLQRAYEHRDAGLTDIRIDPCLRSLRGDPRWGPFLAKMGLAD